MKRHTLAGFMRFHYNIIQVQFGAFFGIRKIAKA